MTRSVHESAYAAARNSASATSAHVRGLHSCTGLIQRTNGGSNMLGKIDATANLAVKNLATARKFYEGTLGLQQVESEGDEVIIYKSGNSKLNVYKSEYAGTNQATAVTWDVDDVDATVQALKGKGVKFEHYDMPGMKLQGDVHVADGMKVAWFKDPDGNILNVISAK
jgi:catechol 2,3-dioxygenase-like lactoylglutathione lyase family enzyme